MKSKVVIIGGGIGGLAAANLLAKAGYDVHVYEQHSQLGGRAGEKVIKGFRFDTGPSWYLMPDVFKQYFNLFNRNVAKELSLLRLKPAYKVFYESRQPITVTSYLTNDAKTFEAIEPGAGKALERYVAASEEAYQMAIKHFLYTNFDRKHELLHADIMKRSVQLARLLFTPIHTHVQKFVRTKALQQILEYPMVFLGSSPFTAPAMYSLMSALDFKEGVYFPKKGMYTIVELLVSIGKEQGVQYHTGEEVRQIQTKQGIATGVTLKSGEQVSADIVISNADLHHTETRLLEAENRSYPNTYWSKKEAGISGLLIYLGVKGALPQLEHHNLFFVDNWKENFTAIYEDKKLPSSASLYVSRTSATDPTTAPKGHENLFVLVPLPTGFSIDRAELTKLTDHFINEIAQHMEVPDLADRIVYRESFGPDQFKEKFHAWQGTALGVSHLLTQSAFWRTSNKSKKVKNLYYVGANTTPGIGVPMCIISAELVFKRIAKIRKGGPLTHGEVR